MLLDLDQEHALDPALAGAKAAKLALARRRGLPVLPGFVVSAPTSRQHMRLGAEALPERGSGGARLLVSGTPLDEARDLVAAGEKLGAELVARSSTLLEGSGRWAGAFTSYLELTPRDLPKAVVGCWASAFGVDVLERLEQVGIEPGSFEMAVLIQPALRPDWGGVAELDEDATTVIHAVHGSPAPLLGGWVPGKTATGDIGSWEGELAGELDGEVLDSIAELILDAGSISGANRCEWAVEDDRVWLLQLDRVERQEPEPLPVVSGTASQWRPIVQTLVCAPGPLGFELVLPWAWATGVPSAPPLAHAGVDDLAHAVRLSRQLAAEVWGTIPDQALATGQRALDRLLGDDQEDILGTFGSLREPDPEISRRLMGIINGLRATLADRGVVDRPEAAWHLTVAEMKAALEGTSKPRARVGSGRWEPLVAAVVLAHGSPQRGAAASPGLGAGLLHAIAESPVGSPPPRSVLFSRTASPVISQLLWDATGVVTRGGSPAAHVFESARSLGVPAVTGVQIEGAAGQIVAVDGFTGTVATFDMR